MSKPNFKSGPDPNNQFESLSSHDNTFTTKPKLPGEMLPTKIYFSKTHNCVIQIYKDDDDILSTIEDYKKYFENDIKLEVWEEERPNVLSLLDILGLKIEDALEDLKDYIPSYQKSMAGLVDQKPLNFTSNLSDPLDEPDYVDPEKLDIFLVDINEMALKEDIACRLEREYLSPADSNVPKWPVMGTIWGHSQRAVVNMVVKMVDKNINVPFVIDTTSPYTYLNASTQKALDPDSPTGTLQVFINEEPTFTYLSHSNFKDCNVLGADFFRKNKKIKLNYEELTVMVDLTHRFSS